MGNYKYRPDNRYPKYWNKLRFKIFYMDKFKCQLCGRKTIPHSKTDRMTTCHHIKPVGLGGEHSIENLVTLCQRCHRFIHEDYIRKKEDDTLHNTLK